jgi:hypothetical protein
MFLSVLMQGSCFFKNKCCFDVGFMFLSVSVSIDVGFMFLVGIMCSVRSCFC